MRAQGGPYSTKARVAAGGNKGGARERLHAFVHMGTTLSHMHLLACFPSLCQGGLNLCCQSLLYHTWTVYRPQPQLLPLDVDHSITHLDSPLASAGCFTFTFLRLQHALSHTWTVHRLQPKQLLLNVNLEHILPVVLGVA